MQRRFFLIVTTSLLLFSTGLKAQYERQDSTYKRLFIGSSLFMLANLVPDDNSADFVQLNFGYRLSRRDAVSLELKTWKYGWPLGIPYGASYEAPEEKFPGFIREFGFSLGYKRYIWKGLFASVDVMNSWQGFYNEQKVKIDNGFQIFNTYRAGYYIPFFKDRFFIEPSLCVTHRPFHTKMPESFKVIDDKWSKFFFGEPGLHFGFNF
ncbi:MAG: hypothetical protein U0X39_08350 [Bacteroidales bacterium]